MVEEYEDDEEEPESPFQTQVEPVGWHRFNCDAKTWYEDVLHEQHPSFISQQFHDWKGPVGAWHCTACGSSSAPPAHLVTCPKPLRRRHKWKGMLADRHVPIGLRCVYCDVEVYPWQPIESIHTTSGYRDRPGYEDPYYD